MKFVWGKRFYVFLFATARGAYNNIIYTSEYKHFHFAKKVRWLAAIRARVRACVRVCPVVFAVDVTQRLTGLCFIYAAWWRWCSRGNCLWTSSPGKLENADCPADGNEWQSCHAAFFLSIPLPPRRPVHHRPSIFFSFSPFFSSRSNPYNPLLLYNTTILHATPSPARPPRFSFYPLLHRVTVAVLYSYTRAHTHLSICYIRAERQLSAVFQRRRQRNNKRISGVRTRKFVTTTNEKKK
jgi:hypothetical protein